MDLPPLRVEIIRRPLKLAPGERWCAGCGFDVPSAKLYEDAKDGSCPRCHQPTLVPAVQVLKPDEFFIAH